MKIIFFIFFLFIFYSCTVSPRYNSLNSNVKSTKINIPQNKKKSNFKNKYYGVSSWYGPNFHGKLTANGEVFDMNAMTAAHKALPLGSLVRVTNLANDKSVTVRINDRGPYVQGRILDCSYGVAKDLGFVDEGTASVRIDVIEFGDNKYRKQ